MRTYDTFTRIGHKALSYFLLGSYVTRDSFCIGWKVLLTSRNEGVALRADPNCFTFKPSCLTLKESWTIFQRIAFPREKTIGKLSKQFI